MKGQHVGYIRVSSVGQNTERQLADIELDLSFIDKASGKDTNRPELTRCLAHLRNGDILHVHSIDRLARNLKDLQLLVEQLTSKGVSVHFHKENLHKNKVFSISYSVRNARDQRYQVPDISLYPAFKTKSCMPVSCLSQFPSLLCKQYKTPF